MPAAMTLPKASSSKSWSPATSQMSTAGSSRTIQKPKASRARNTGGKVAVMKPSAPQAASSAERACQVIRDAIQSGQYPGGSWLREQSIAERAQVSRTSVRQAFNMLAAEGFVELHPNRGAMVVDWTEENLLQVFDLRAMLEGYGCELAALNRTEQDLAALQAEADVFSNMVAAPTAAERRSVAESNNRFHRLILSAGRNQRLASLLVAVARLRVQGA